MDFNIIGISLNPSIDVTMWIDDIDFEEPVKPIKEKVYTGGKSINVSKVLSSFKTENKVIGVAGKDNFDGFKKLLEKDKISYEFFLVEGSVRENVSIVLKDNRMLKINRKGCKVDFDIYQNIKDVVDNNIVLDKKNILMFCGSMPPNLSAVEYKKFIMSFKDENNLIVIDNDIFSLEDIKEISPFIIKPNHIEIEKMLCTKIDRKKDLLKNLYKFDGFVENVIVSFGDEGLVYYNGKTNKLLDISVPNISVKSTIGAGDSVLAGFIHYYVNGKSIEDCIKFGASCGTIAVTIEGTDTVDLKDVTQFVDNIKIILDN